MVTHADIVTSLSNLKQKTTRFNYAKRDRTPQHQLALAVDSLSLTAIYATPSTTKTPHKNWWNIRCGCNHKMFGGLYSTAERDKFLLHFKGRRDQIELSEFAAIAERIIAETYTVGEVAA